MKYHDPTPVSRHEAEKILQGNDEERICETLIALALHDPERAWVEERCLRCTEHPKWAVRAIAATALGHLARIHMTLDLVRVLPRLDALMTDAKTAGYAKTALDDLRVYVPEVQAAHRRDLEDVLSRALAMLARTLKKPIGPLEADDFARTVELFDRFLDEAREISTPEEVERYLRDEMHLADETAHEIALVYRALALGRNDPRGPWWPEDVVEKLFAKAR